MERTVTGKIGESIKKAADDLVQQKLRFADATLIAERQRQEVLAAEERLIKVTHKAARALGIDPTDPSKGRWHFDPATMTFREVQDA